MERYLDCRATGEDDRTVINALDALTGAHKFRVRAGFVGLRWSDVSSSLSSAGRQFLRREFVPVALETFTGTTPDFWAEWLSDDSLDDLHGLVLVLDGDSRPAAWVASNVRMFGGRRCFYANSAGVHPKYQGSGLSSAIWRELLRRAILESAPRELHAVMRTANPLVYGAWSAAAGGDERTFPSPNGTSIPTKIQDIAADAARELNQHERFDPETLVIRDAYERTANGLWAERPTSDQDAIDLWMGTILGPKDAILLVVVFQPLSMIVGEVTRTIRRRLGIATGRTSSSRQQR